MKRMLKFFGAGGHDCRDVVEKLELLLDGELDNEAEQNIIKEIKRCPACLEHYNIDKTFKDFLQTRVEKKCCSEKLKGEILERIRDIDEADGSSV